MDETPRQSTVFDADQQQVGEIYAHALVAIGQKQGQPAELLSQLEAFGAVLDELPRLKAALESPRIAVADKHSLLDKALGDRFDRSLRNFLQVIVEKGRFNCLGAIARASRGLVDEMSGRVVASVTTAEPMDDSTRSRLAERLGQVLGKTVEVQTKQDPGLIGGLVVRVGDTVYDGSIANHLKQLRKRAFQHASDAIRGSIDKFISS